MRSKLLVILMITSLLFSGCKSILVKTDNEKMVEETALATEETVDVEGQPTIEPEEEPEKKTKEEPGDFDKNVLLDMSPEQRREVNIFLSNFSEAFYEPNQGYYSEAEAKISFAYIHSLINGYNTTFYEDNYMGISAKDVDNVLVRFFGSSVSHQTPPNSVCWIYKDGKFLMPAASGESYPYFSIATEMKKRPDGDFDVKFNIYSDPSITGGDMITDKTVYSLSNQDAASRYEQKGHGNAVLKSKVYNGSDTYEVVSYESY